MENNNPPLPSPEPREEIILLKRATNEIKYLRQDNQHMATRLRMFDDMMLVIRVRTPEQGASHTPDLCSEINNFIERDEFKETYKNSQTSPPTHP